MSRIELVLRSASRKTLSTPLPPSAADPFSSPWNLVMNIPLSSDCSLTFGPMVSWSGYQWSKGM